MPARPPRPTRSSPRPAAPPVDPGAPAPADLTPIIAGNLRRLRARHGLSLERLAGLSRVSRAMLGQIELGQSSPTVNVLWKVALALDVPFSALIGAARGAANTLLPAAEAKLLGSPGGAFRARALFPSESPRRTEFHELWLAAGAEERAEPRAPGTSGNLVVAEGALELRVGEESFQLAQGDALFFEADRGHVYRNPGEREARIYLVTIFPCPTGG